MIKNFFDVNSIDYRKDVSLKKYNTYRINATCSYLVFPKDEQELILIMSEIKKNNIKYFILGNGSNIILSKAHYDGVVIKLDNFNEVVYDNDLVTVGAGYSLIRIANETIDKGYDGLSFATGIPGAVGASTVMNAGAYNMDMAQSVVSVKVLNDRLEIENLNNSQLEYEYRDSFLKKNKEYIVLSTTFKLIKGDKTALKELADKRRVARMESQPLDMPSAGSVFRNPVNMYAGKLIEELNLKGYSIGGAQVSVKHANFIVNVGDATGNDIVRLIKKIQNDVKKEYKVDLRLEQVIIE